MMGLMALVLNLDINFSSTTLFQWHLLAVSTVAFMPFCIIDEAWKMCLRLQVRISVTFLKGWPVIKRVRLCFASKPQVTMSYRPMDRNGIDVSLIPVFANVVVRLQVVSSAFVSNFCHHVSQEDFDYWPQLTTCQEKMVDNAMELSIVQVNQSLIYSFVVCIMFYL